jgi:hypothetical protein
MVEWIRNLALGDKMKGIYDWLRPDVAPPTPFKTGFDAFMKKKDPTYDSYTQLFAKFGRFEDDDAFVDPRPLLQELFEVLEDQRDEVFAETATTIHAQMKMKVELGAKFKETLANFFNDLYDEVLSYLFVELHDVLTDATVSDLQTDDGIHKKAYLVALLWLLISNLYVPELLEGKKDKNYTELQGNIRVFEAALLLAKQAPQFVTYTDAFYTFHTGTVQPLPLSNLTEAKNVLLDFTKPYFEMTDEEHIQVLKDFIKEDTEKLKDIKKELKDATLTEEERKNLEAKKTEITEKLEEYETELKKLKKEEKDKKKELGATETIVHRFVSPNDDQASKSYLVLDMRTTTTNVSAEYVPVGQPCVGADGAIWQAFTNRPEDMFPMLVESTVLSE